MDLPDGARTFSTSGAAYDGFMGRYSKPLAVKFADMAEVTPGQTVLDVGCGPGALTGVLVERLGAAAVSAFDPSPPFVADCSARYPGVDIRAGRAEAIPFGDAMFDAALAQLVLHFVTDPVKAIAEMVRVVRPGGVIAACVWDFDHGMEMLRCFWDAALTIDPDAPDEATVLRFGRGGEIAQILEEAGLDRVGETTLEVESSYTDFNELWSGFLAGIGPAGAFCMSLPDDRRKALGEELCRRVGEPAGGFTMRAVARCAAGRRPVPPEPN